MKLEKSSEAKNDRESCDFLILGRSFRYKKAKIDSPVESWIVTDIMYGEYSYSDPTLDVIIMPGMSPRCIDSNVLQKKGNTEILIPGDINSFDKFVIFLHEHGHFKNKHLRNLQPEIPEFLLNSYSTSVEENVFSLIFQNRPLQITGLESMFLDMQSYNYEVYRNEMREEREANRYVVNELQAVLGKEMYLSVRGRLAQLFAHNQLSRINEDYHFISSGSFPRNHILEHLQKSFLLDKVWFEEVRSIPKTEISGIRVVANHKILNGQIQPTDREISHFAYATAEDISYSEPELIDINAANMGARIKFDKLTSGSVITLYYGIGDDQSETYTLIDSGYNEIVESKTFRQYIIQNRHGDSSPGRVLCIDEDGVVDMDNFLYVFMSLPKKIAISYPILNKDLLNISSEKLKYLFRLAFPPKDYYPSNV